MTPIAGFAPDSDPCAPGVLMDCTNIVPYPAGFKGAPSPVSVGANALAAECRGAVVATKLDGSRRVFAGTQTKLYELSGTTWTDRSAGTIAAPVQSAPSTSTTGGTLAAATYYYVITALNAYGETVASNEVSQVTTGTTSKNTLTWAAVTGATSYRVYRGTAAAGENVYYAPGNVLTYADTGAANTAGTPPAANTTGGYTGSSESRWSFCQFGDTTVASNLTDAMQSSASGAFAAIASAPKAKVVVSASNNFVLAFNTNDATFGQLQDGWWCCAQNDQTSWTPSVSTSANRGRLIAVEGAIQAAMTLGDYVVAYKQRAVFVGIYVGAPVVWQWNLIPGGECGAVGQEAVCDIGGAHFIVGNDNFWLFDGTRPIPLGTGVNRQWFLDNSSPTYRYRTKAIYDKQNNLVRVNYPSNTSNGTCDACLVFHVGSKRWGRNDVTIEAPVNYISPGVTIDGLNAYASTIDTLPNIPFDSQYWLSGGQVPAYFNGSHTLVSMTGASTSSSITTGDLGDDNAVSMLDRFRMRFLRAPTTATATGFSKMNEGDNLQAGATNAINDGKFDLRQSGRFHRVRVDMTGDHAETEFEGQPKKAGWR